MSKVTKLPEPEAHAPKAGELLERVVSLIHEYDGEMGVSEAIGVLELAKLKLIGI